MPISWSSALIRRSVLALVTSTLAIGSITALAGGGGAPPQAAPTPSTNSTANSNILRVTTTMAGMRMRNLPLRMRWTAKASVPDSDLVSTEFYIDGKLISTPRDAPYTFAGTGNNRVMNYLVTTWLTPGQHTFTTTVKTLDGRTASETVVANVVAPPAPPAALAGAWERVITVADFEAAGNTPQADPILVSLLGRPWRAVFDRTGAWILDPGPGGVLEHINVQGNIISFLGNMHRGPSGTIMDYGTPIGANGSNCAPGEEGRYTWSVAGDMLTLTPITPGCPSLHAIFAGTWKRVMPTPAR